MYYATYIYRYRYVQCALCIITEIIVIVQSTITNGYTMYAFEPLYERNMISLGGSAPCMTRIPAAYTVHSCTHDEIY